jgi:2'-hydroxyisoflavone reductase
MREMLTTVARSLRTSPHIVWVPAAFLEQQKLQAWSDIPVWVPGEGDSAGFAKRSIQRALRTGLTFRPLGTTAVDTLAWFRQQPAERQAKLRAGLTADRESVALAAWSKSSRSASS